MSEEANEKIVEWNLWFELVGLTREWSIVKAQYPNNINRQLSAAGIIELNRIVDEMERKAATDAAIIRNNQRDVEGA